MWRWVSFLTALCLAAVSLQGLLFNERPFTEVPPVVALPTHAFVIALDPEKGEMVAVHVKKHMALSSVTVVAANTGIGEDDLPLYTRNLIDKGRFDHMQIGNRQMVGCLLSHASVWAQVDRWAYVFEDDAVLHQGSRALTQWLMADVQSEPWSILMLQERSYIAEHAFTAVGKLAATCDNCTWFGTRGYIITKQGAQTLLNYVRPVIVQVDSLVGLVNCYEPSFHLYWTRREIVGIFSRLQTTVWDWCLRCYAGTSVGWWALGVVVGCAALLGVGAARLSCSLKTV